MLNESWVSDDSVLGILKNTVLGIPSATLQVAKGIGQSIARSAGSAGLTVAKTLGGTPELKPEDLQSQKGKEAYRIFFGNEPIKAIEDRIAETEINIQNSPFAKDVGLDKYAQQIAFGTVLGGTLLDLTPFGGLEKNAVKSLVKETSEVGVKKILSNMKVPETIANKFASTLAKSKSEGEVLDILTNIKGITGIGEAVGRGTATQADSLFGKVPVVPKDDGVIVSKLLDALKQAKPIRAQQEKIYTVEKGVRLAKSQQVSTKGEAGFYERLSKFGGEYEKKAFQSFREQFTQKDTDRLFDMVNESVALTEWERLPAGTGLRKIFSGQLPTENELLQLKKVFGQEVVDELVAMKNFFTRAKELGFEIANIPRSLMSSGDLSAPLRQGLFLIPSHPVVSARAFGKMFKMFGSEKTFQKIMTEIQSRPTYPLMKEAKLALADVGGSLSTNEEKFMSNLAEKIPLIGRLVRASGRGYTGYLNKVRADVFDIMVKSAELQGFKPKENLDFAKEAANFINAASGRGSLHEFARVYGLGKSVGSALESSAVITNSLIFSPRLLASRLILLNPYYYLSIKNPVVRRESLKSLFGLAGVVGTALSLFKLNDWEIGTDWRSSDFLKAKKDNTRVDVMGGFQQYIRMVGQLVTGEYVSSVSGKEYTLGEGYKPITRFDILERQAQSKLAPVASFIVALLKQQDYLGQPISIPKEIGERMVPIVWGDIQQIAKENPKLLPIVFSGIFGIGTQTYSGGGSGKAFWDTTNKTSVDSTKPFWAK